MNNLQVITHNNERVLTTTRLAEQYGTTEKRISNNFNENKNRYVESCLSTSWKRPYKFIFF